MKLKVFVAAIAMLGLVTTANAADTAWFSLENAPAGVTANLVDGQLQIEKDDGLAPNPVTLVIGYNFTNTNIYSSGLMSSWSISLSSPDAGLSIGGLTYDLAGGYDSQLLGGSGASPGTFLDSFGQGSTSQSGGVGLVGTFELIIDKGIFAGPYNIFGAFGGSEQIYDSGYAWFGAVGPNVSDIYGTIGTSFGALPVITITNIPEPATIGLLGLGVVALIRRRR